MPRALDLMPKHSEASNRRIEGRGQNSWQKCERRLPPIVKSYIQHKTSQRQQKISSQQAMARGAERTDEEANE